MYTYLFNLTDDYIHVNQIVIHAASAPEAWLLLATKILIDDISTDAICLVETQNIK